MPTLTAREISITDLESQFNLHYTDDLTFFSEWQDNLPLLSDAERERCDRIKTSFSYLLRYPPLLENMVKMVVLYGLLDMAGFFFAPFSYSIRNLYRNHRSRPRFDSERIFRRAGSVSIILGFSY